MWCHDPSSMQCSLFFDNSCCTLLPLHSLLVEPRVSAVCSWVVNIITWSSQLHTDCTCVYVTSLINEVTGKLLSLCTVWPNSRKVSTRTVLPLHFWVGTVRTYMIVMCKPGKHMCMSYQEIWGENKRKTIIYANNVYTTRWTYIPSGFILKSEDFQVRDFSKTASFEKVRTLFARLWLFGFYGRLSKHSRFRKIVFYFFTLSLFWSCWYRS